MFLSAQRASWDSPVEALGAIRQGAPRCWRQTTALLNMLRLLGITISLLELTSYGFGELKAWAWFAVIFERVQQVINNQSPDAYGKQCGSTCKGKLDDG